MLYCNLSWSASGSIRCSRRRQAFLVRVLSALGIPGTMCGLSNTRQGITRPRLSTDALLDFHHARLSVSHAMRRPAAACHGKCCQVPTRTQWGIHWGHVLWLYGVQRLQMMRNTDIRHLSQSCRPHSVTCTMENVREQKLVSCERPQTRPECNPVRVQGGQKPSNSF